MRIVSLLPSATEIICALGLSESLVGVSHECDYPPYVRKLPVVTDTLIPKGLSSVEIDHEVREQLSTKKALYSLDMSMLQSLRPTVIVTQALCDVCAVAADEVNDAACQLPGQPDVINLEPMSIQDVLDTLLLVSQRTGKEREGQRVVARLRERIELVKETTSRIPPAERPTVGFLEWIDPLFNAGHWTPELIALAGGTDCFGSLNEPSHTLSPQVLCDSDPDLLFIALCGFDIPRTRQDLPLLRSLPDWDKLNCVRQRRLYFTDGNAYFSRPGPRLVESLELLAHCLHPTLHPLPPGLDPAVRFASA